MDMTLPVVIQVPEADKFDLQTLMESPYMASDDPVTVRPFDGESLQQWFAIITSAAFPYLKLWIETRLKDGKEVALIVDGSKIPLEGKTAEELEEIFRPLKARAEQRDNEQRRREPHEGDDTDGGGGGPEPATKG